MDNRTGKKRDAPKLDSIEGGLLGAVLGFHQKTMSLLREANLDDEKSKLAAERIKLLIDGMHDEIKGSKDLNVRERLESVYEEAKRLVDELCRSPNQNGGKSA